jgi:uncharacterized protein YfbU (UPF0304 family)
MQLSDGEKLILLMLCEIQEHLKMKGETNTGLIKEAIFSGNLWGLEWDMSGVFHGSETPKHIVSETVDILCMWQRLEESYNRLSPDDKTWLAENVEVYKNVKFDGFDGNDPTEVQYISASRFLVEHLGRFEIFKNRDFNAHMTKLDAYRLMLPIFDPILKRVLNKDFSKEQIVSVLDAYIHPDHKKLT